jgi:cytochrome c5
MMRLVGLVVLYLAASTPLNAQPAGGALPPGEGRDVLATACTQCHGLGTIMAMRDGPGGWKLQVYNMVIRGAQLTGPETETVISYLAANFGPGSQRPPGTQVAAVALPDGAGKELVETRCALCHDLARVVGIKRPPGGWDSIVANMIQRGAPATAEEGRTISAYLATQFGGN